MTLIYEEIAPAIRKLYHNKVAGKLEDRLKNKGKVEASDIAYHYAKADEHEKSIQFALEAGTKALSSSLIAEAIGQFQYVIEHTSNLQKFVEENETAIEGLGDALFACADTRAIITFEQLSQNARSFGIRIRALRKAARASLVQGNYAQAFVLAKKPIDVGLLDRLEGARFCLVRGMVEAWGGYTKDALKDLLFSLRTFEEENSIAHLIDALTEVGTAYMGRDDSSP